MVMFSGVFSFVFNRQSTELASSTCGNNLTLIDVSSDTEKPGEVWTNSRWRVHGVRRRRVGIRWKVLHFLVTAVTQNTNLHKQPITSNNLPTPPTHH